MPQIAAPRPAARAAAILLVATLLLAAAAGPVGAAMVTVHIRESLSPKTLTVRPGTAVRWVNESGNRYRMRSRFGPVEFDSGNLEPGETFTFTFTAVGTYPYLDDRERDDTDFHGTIVVAEGPAATGDQPAGGTTGQPAPGQPAPAQTVVPTIATVRMAGRAFSPGDVTVAAGGTVTFVNDDDREHSASGTGQSFDTGILAPGARSQKSFAAPGTYRFICVIHTEMSGSITVRAAAAAAAPPAPPVDAAPNTAPTPPASALAAAPAVVPAGEAQAPAEQEAEPAPAPAAAVDSGGVLRIVLVLVLVCSSITAFGWLIRGAARPREEQPAR